MKTKNLITFLFIILSSAIFGQEIPTINIQLINKSATSLTLKWDSIAGNNYMVIINKDTDPVAMPVNGTTYRADSVYGRGVSVGNNNFVVHNNARNFVTVTNLSPNTIYTVIVYPYKKTEPIQNVLYDQISFYQAYYVFCTLESEPNDISKISLLNIDSTTIKLQISQDPNIGRLYILRPIGSSVAPSDGMLYAYNLNYGNASASIGNNTYVVYNENPSNYSATPITVTITNLEVGAEYELVRYSYLPGSYPNYGYQWNTINYIYNDALQFTTKINSPDKQASNIQLNTKTSTTASFSWSRGSGSKCIVVISALNNSVLPVQKTNYTASAQYTKGDSVRNKKNYVVYNGAGTSIQVSNLTANTSYKATIYEYKLRPDKKAAYNLSVIENINTITFNTLSNKPTLSSRNIVANVTSNSISFTFKKGNGEKRLIKVGILNNLGKIEDGKVYTADSRYTYGTALTANDYVIYDGNGESVEITNLKPNQKYEVFIYEYNQGSFPSSNQYALNTRSYFSPTSTSITTLSSSTRSKKTEQPVSNELIETSSSQKLDFFNVYPNPCSNTLNIALYEYHTNTGVSIINALGQTVFRDQLTNQLTQIDLSSFVKGVYFIEVKSKNEMQYKKIIIE